MTRRGRVLVDAWYRGAWWLWLLRPLEGVFRGVVALRRALYRSGLLKSYVAPLPVVVVGNITVGGAGKTPVVIALADALQAHGIAVGVVSRGYGGSGVHYPYRVSANSEADLCGDEPLLVHRRTGCAIVVAPDRADAVRTLLAEERLDIILSDDGLQHYGLARDLEIAVLDARLKTGNGFCLPAGPLREPPRRLRTVDFVLYRGSDDPQCGVCYEPVCLVNLSSGERRPVLPEGFGGKVCAVAGIGQPQQFFDTLRAMGFVIEEHPLGDHHRYTAEDFAGMAGRSIIMTEKDAIKCRGIAGDNAWYLQIEARLPERVTTAVMALARP